MTSIMLNKSIDFAIDIAKIAQNLKKNHEYVFCEQLLKSGTSIGANLAEAHYAQSRADFISKLSISLKETNETKYWLLLLLKVGFMSPEQYKEMNSKCNELCLMISSSIKTAKANVNKI